jgi:FtsP/CotA-like multicopper oxidase with cupredoxin domain
MRGRTFTRRRALTAAASILGTGLAARLVEAPPAPAAVPPTPMHDGPMQGGFAEGRQTVDPATNGFDPAKIARDFDEGKTRRLAGGRVLREWELVAYDKEIEVVPGVRLAAWTFNGRVPGPTLRCREGELLRIHFVNDGSHPHTIHFHGIHRALMDGVPGIGEEVGGGLIQPGKRFTYEFEAEPFGLHLYHCHAFPLAEHISKGLYGAFIIDPK